MPTADPTGGKVLARPHPGQKRPGRPRGSKTAKNDTTLFLAWKKEHDANKTTKEEFLIAQQLPPSNLAAIERGRKQVERNADRGEK